MSDTIASSLTVKTTADNDPSVRYADILRGEISSGVWGPDQILQRKDLAHRFDVPLKVISRAMQRLTDEGLVETRIRLGTRPRIAGRSWNPPQGTLVQHIMRTLRARIADGTYRVGRRLPTQDRLAAEFGVSGSVISSALQPLKAEGLVSTDVNGRRRGAVVARTPRTEQTAPGPVLAPNTTRPGMSEIPA
ncbi:GntR family transcriptional regulator [Streptomyces griseiscabiei]|uniref:GntR family transcriptional regulator n=1 Tax=Streptomyces griseiscabiei TaxID=2993540 RepID=A0ABU4LK46_9ACTN|nr:GntR family transcriptional regulator [Streptomyces griseiscabiei]MBZ3906548.1 GntR family transcriptional regulator [Streptomyces griseiscabiei]MDX2916161.1 GntR family transcriptional regulator [Streptomyces griseiscabiei]